MTSPNHTTATDAPASSSESLQLVPETILKKKHDLDELRAQRASHLLMHPKNRLRNKTTNNDTKIFKPETLLAAARSKRNHTIRWKRVAKKGMQARAKHSTKKIIIHSQSTEGSVRGVDTSSNTNGTCPSSSVGAKLVFCVRIRDAFGMPTQVKKTLSKFNLRNVYEVFIVTNEIFDFI